MEEKSYSKQAKHSTIFFQTNFNHMLSSATKTLLLSRKTFTVSYQLPKLCFCHLDMPTEELCNISSEFRHCNTKKWHKITKAINPEYTTRWVFASLQELIQELSVHYLSAITRRPDVSSKKGERGSEEKNRNTTKIDPKFHESKKLKQRRILQQPIQNSRPSDKTDHPKPK